MTEMKRLDMEDLNSISGGEGRVVNTRTTMPGVVRKGPGFSSPQVATLPNGTWVNTTGLCERADGRTWYQINAPYNGYMAGSLLGLPD